MKTLLLAGYAAGFGTGAICSICWGPAPLSSAIGSFIGALGFALAHFALNRPNA